MTELLGFLRLGFFSFRFGPAFFHDLAGAAQGKRIGRDVFGDGGGGGHVSAFADPERRDQDVSLPTKTPSSMTVLCLFTPS